MNADMTPRTPGLEDLIEELREEALRLARASFDSQDAGIAANLATRAADALEALSEHRYVGTRNPRTGEITVIDLERGKIVGHIPKESTANVLCLTCGGTYGTTPRCPGCLND